MKGLDTTVLIDGLRKDPGLAKRLEALELEALVTTEVNAFETLLGIHFKGGPHLPQRLEAARRVLQDLIVLPLERGGAERAAQVAGELARQGRSINTGDALTAGILLDHGIATLVTRDVQHFERIPGLAVETY